MIASQSSSASHEENTNLGDFSYELPLNWLYLVGFDDEFDGFGACVAEVVIGAGGVDSASDVIGEAGEVLVREIY